MTMSVESSYIQLVPDRSVFGRRIKKNVENDHKPTFRLPWDIFSKFAVVYNLFTYSKINTNVNMM